jgi:hypothetical protein
MGLDFSPQDGTLSLEVEAPDAIIPVLHGVPGRSTLPGGTAGIPRSPTVRPRARRNPPVPAQRDDRRQRRCEEGQDGDLEENFRDTYKFNIAAYEVARLVGLEGLMPVTVERKYKGRDGSLSWWFDSTIDEQERSKKNIQPPDPESYNRQMLRILVFNDLVYDTDRNPGNVLITQDWRLIMIDFSRAFRLETRLEDLDDLNRCDRSLLASLRSLKEADVLERTRRYLSREEVGAVMARRSALVAHFDRQIARRGEAAVLYD